MGRIPDLKPEEMTERQKQLAAEIAGPRGGVVRGPFAIWLRNPELVDKANQLGNLLREGTSVPRRLSELAILVTARHWTAQYEWFAHEQQALDQGVTKDVVEAIRARKTPNFAKPDERVTYAICHEMYENKRVSDATYKAAIDTLGQQMVIELITIATFYAMIAMFLVTFEAAVPGGAKPLPE
jgi:4-carboxymuconolactone decarboxylase